MSTARLLNSADLSGLLGMYVLDANMKNGSNDTPYIQGLIDAGVRYFLVPRTETPWFVGDLQTPLSGVGFLGQSDPRYFSQGTPTPTQLNGQSCFRLPAGATCMFKTPGYVSIENMWLYGLGKALTDPPVFLSSTGAKLPDIFVRRCNMHLFSLGFGERTTYFGTSLMEECIVSYCYHGAGYVVDSKIKGGFLHSNDSHGIYFSPGSNDNVAEGPKLEFNNGCGMFVFGGRRNQGSLILFDSNALDGLRVESSSANQRGELTISASTLRRNGRTAGNRNIYLRNPGLFLASGLITQHDVNDNGTGTDRPGTGIEVLYTNGGVPAGSLTRMRDCDLTGFATTALTKTGDSFLTAAGGSLKISDCAGVADTTI